jgi:hypothetical protein
MAYVDKLVNTQDAVMHDFKGEDHDDGGSRSQAVQRGLCDRSTQTFHLP